MERGRKRKGWRERGKKHIPYTLHRRPKFLPLLLHQFIPPQLPAVSGKVVGPLPAPKHIDVGRVRHGGVVHKGRACGVFYAPGEVSEVELV